METKKHHNKKPDTPGSYKGPPACKFKDSDGVVCGQPAFNWLHLVLTIMERETKCRVAFCDVHFSIIRDDNTAYSIGKVS
jgi:hypothetical protein